MNGEFSLKSALKENLVQPESLTNPTLNDYADLRAVRQSMTNTSPTNSAARLMLDGFSIQSNGADIVPSKQSENLIAEARCVTGTASYYTPGGTTADGTPYTSDMQGVAIDMHSPVLGAHLGSKLVITNEQTGAQTTVRVHDVGNFGDLDGGRRLVDLSLATKNKIGAGDITPVKVCVPDQ